MTSERDAMLSRLAGGSVDVLVVGGGINGAVAAAALAGHGVQVALVDRADFASGVSSHSSNLAWGGIKYLESGEWRLVRKLCLSRNRLMDAFPSTVREIRFFTSIQRGFRMWSVLVWLGALLYWLMGNCRMSAPRFLRRKTIIAEAPVINASEVVGGLEYSDCYLFDNDSRFVFNFIRRAMDAGATAANYTEVTALEFSSDQQHWQVSLRDCEANRDLQLTAKVVINATGPNVDRLNATVGVDTEHHHLLSKGVHLIVDRVTPLAKVLTFFASDGRLFFVIPMGPKTCIGTTDTQVARAEVSVSNEDRDFVLANANALLELPEPLTRDDIIAERVGVRPLAIAGADTSRDWVQLSRKHQLEIDDDRHFISIFGGKLTDCLNVGEELVAAVSQLGVITRSPEQRWYGEPDATDRRRFLERAQHLALDELTEDGVSEPLSLRFWRRYGNYANELLDTIGEHPDKAKLVIPEAEYTHAELELMSRREMIVHFDDFLRRRSKIALVVPGRSLRKESTLRGAARLLFGDSAAAKLAEYLEG
ncbi:FAD dependent oxidoreductase [Luminiphilus syltensis NOR5-1B]|uniref:FAD dependent oxidoreductase n=1 Tax=Luminiphilus syltensis NOR5-1B TaxID=565045 RepID=B8KTM7_9GAMM|nr:glycerol-3-phosphate dehydrogenase/oxidase [Luminiphilus syltensis]EED35466.1 FAD dependent oxidoreductase [Luminiphilus syltensis NOR5-1B]